LINILLFLVLTLLAEIVGTIGGFGSSIFFVPIAQFFFDFQTVLALTGLLHIFSNTAKLILFRKSIDWKITAWLGITSVVLAIVGAYATRYMDFAYAKLILSVFLLIFSITFYLKPSFTVSPSRSNAIMGGSLAGFMAGFIGTGGVIRGLLLTSFNMEKSFFVGTSAAIDFGVDLSRTMIYLDHQLLDKKLWWYIPVLVGAAFLGSYFGKLLLSRLPQQSFKKFVLALIFSIGIIMLFNELYILLADENN
jgi:uncharacterized protein